MTTTKGSTRKSYAGPPRSSSFTFGLIRDGSYLPRSQSEISSIGSAPAAYVHAGMATKGRRGYVLSKHTAPATAPKMKPPSPAKQAAASSCWSEVELSGHWARTVKVEAAEEALAVRKLEDLRAAAAAASGSGSEHSAVQAADGTGDSAKQPVGVGGTWFSAARYQRFDGLRSAREGGDGNGCDSRTIVRTSNCGDNSDKRIVDSLAAVSGEIPLLGVERIRPASRLLRVASLEREYLKTSARPSRDTTLLKELLAHEQPLRQARQRTTGSGGGGSRGGGSRGSPSAEPGSSATAVRDWRVAEPTPQCNLAVLRQRLEMKRAATRAAKEANEELCRELERHEAATRFVQ